MGRASWDVGRPSRLREGFLKSIPHTSPETLSLFVDYMDLTLSYIVTYIKKTHTHRKLNTMKNLVTLHTDITLSETNETPECILYDSINIKLKKQT